MKCGEIHTCHGWIKCPSCSPLYYIKNPSEMDHCVTLLSRYMKSMKWLNTFIIHSVFFFTDLGTVISAGVLADISAVVQRSGSPSVGQGTWSPSSAEDPAGSYGHNTWTGFLLIYNLSVTYSKGKISVQLILFHFISECPVFHLPVLEQGHSSFGRHRCGHVDQHCIRERCWSSSCLESAAGLSVR